MKKRLTGTEQLIYLSEFKAYVNKNATKVLTAAYVNDLSPGELLAVLASPEDPAGTLYCTGVQSEAIKRDNIDAVRKYLLTTNI